MTTPAMPELPEPELGYIETDKSRQPAFSARQMREALQSAQPAAPSCVFGAVPLRPGDTLGPQTAACLTCGQPPACLSHPAGDRQQGLSITGEQPAAVSDGEIVKLAFEMCSACYSGMDHQFAGMSVVKFARAILALRPQAVPMTRAQRLEVFRKAEDRMAHDINLCWRNALIEETEAHHGITAQAKKDGAA